MSNDDRGAIQDVLVRLGRWVDDREWERLATLFADTVHVDYTSLWGGEPETLDREELVARWRELLPGLDATQHFVGHVLADVDADRSAAAAVANVIGVHRLANPSGGPLWTVGGTYRTRLVRGDSGWRISALTLDVAWTDGNTNVMNLAAHQGTT